jgi:hypothetical protein
MSHLDKTSNPVTRHREYVYELIHTIFTDHLVSIYGITPANSAFGWLATILRGEKARNASN